MKERRLLVISTEFPPGPGGIGYHAFYIIKELRQLGWEITVASEQNYADEREIKSFNSNSVYPIYRLFPIPSVFLLIKKVIYLATIILKHKPTVIMGTGKHGSWFAYLMARMFFRKCVLIGHGTEFTVSMSDRSKKINRWVYSKCDLLVCVSNYTLKKAEEEGIKPTNGVVIHNGADNGIFRVSSVEEIRQFKLQKQLVGKKIILTAGNVSDRKGQEWVIRAMPEIIKNVPNAHYYCVGKAPEGEKMKLLAAQLNVQDRVHLIGMVKTEELVLWMSACDIFAMTSVYVKGDFEGFGIAVIEAACCERPAIVSNQSGLKEAIVEGETGFGVKEKDFLAIAEKVEMLLNNQEMLSKMGRHAFQYATENLTWKKVAKRYDAYMTALIE